MTGVTDLRTEQLAKLRWSVTHAYENTQYYRAKCKSAGVTPSDISSPDDLALIQYTSGSTGSPKGVCVTHDNLMSNCEVLSRSMGPDPNRVGLSWLPKNFLVPERRAVHSAYAARVQPTAGLRTIG